MSDINQYDTDFPDLETADVVLNTESDLTERTRAGFAFDPVLAALRAKHPFVEILPIPNQVITRLLAANTEMTIQIPSGTKWIRIISDGQLAMSRTGTASYPIGTDVTDQMNAESGSIVNPLNVNWYVHGIQALSFISLIGCNVSVNCYMQEG